MLTCTLRSLRSVYVRATRTASCLRAVRTCGAGRLASPPRGGYCTYAVRAPSYAPRVLWSQAASLCSGRNFWQLKGIPRLGLESVTVADGPHGLRCQENEADHLGMGASLPATCFPTAVTLAATWDVGLLHEVGRPYP